VDDERLGVLGGSYGGFMTSWIVGHTNRFKAACSERAVNSLVSAYGSSDLFWAFAGQCGSYLYDMTSWIVGHTNRFKAACSERAVNSLVSAYGSSDLFWAFAGQFGSFLYDDFDAWVEHSP